MHLYINFIDKFKATSASQNLKNYSCNPAYTPSRVNVPLPDIPNITGGHEAVYEEVGYEQIWEVGKEFKDGRTFDADYLYMEQDYY